LAKPPPGGGLNTGLQRPFPVITPQSYLPGSAGAGGGFMPPIGAGQFPVVSPNSYLPQSMPMMPPMGGYPPPIPYQNMNPMSMMGPPPPPYNPQYDSYSRRPMRRRHHRRRRCRPVIRIVEADSCSSLSTCSTISSCSRRRHRSRSYSRRCRTTPQQQQQPIIFLPIQCQQPSSGITNSIQGRQQQLALPPMQFQQSGQGQQQLALPPIQLSSSSIMQPSFSMPQVTPMGQGQQYQAGPIQYVQAMPQSSSTQLQYISARPQSSMAPQHVLVNSTNKKQLSTVQPVQRSISTRDVPQNDLKFERRSIDRYASDRKKNTTNDNIRLRQREGTRVT
jgi:hypothetical protein